MKQCLDHAWFSEADSEEAARAEMAKRFELICPKPVEEKQETSSDDEELYGGPVKGEVSTEEEGSREPQKFEKKAASNKLIWSRKGLKRLWRNLCRFGDTH